MAEANATVLIVDDDGAMLTALHAILKRYYTVYSAASGETALQIAFRNKPDIILLDVIMPEMDGFEVLAELKRTDSTRKIPVIMLTGLNEVENEEKCFRAGAVDYIRKPFHGSIVLARLQTHLDISLRLREKEGGGLTLKTRQEVRNIIFSELMYVDVSGHWLNFHLSNGQNVEIYSTLKEYEDILLSDARFARCHKSFVVNMDFIDAVEIRDEARDVILKNGELLPVSKTRLSFKRTYAEWIGRR